MLIPVCAFGLYAEERRKNSISEVAFVGPSKRPSQPRYQVFPDCNVGSSAVVFQTVQQAWYEGQEQPQVLDLPGPSLLNL